MLPRCLSLPSPLPRAARPVGASTLVLALLGALLAVGLLPGSPARAATVADYAGLRINEVEANGSPNDWVELTNISEKTLDLSGVLVLDDGGKSGTNAFQAIPSGVTLAPGAFYAFDSTVNGLGNSADAVRLYPPGTANPPGSAATIDSFTWTTAAGAGVTWGRCPNGWAATLTRTASATRGGPNDCGTLPVAINEVESNGDTVHGDWIEVVNNGTSTVDLTGWTVLDDDDTHTRKPFPANTMLAPGDHVAITTDSGTPQFGLGGADSARLFNPAGTLVDAYTWATHAPVTYGRCPDGTGPFVATAVSSFAAPNDCASPVRINEIQTSGTANWVELGNTVTTAADVSGWTLTAAGGSYPLPAGSSVAAGGYLAVDLPFDLASTDSVTLTDAGAKRIDGYTYTADASPTYGRCPDLTGSITTTQRATKGSRNICPGDIVPDPWPGGDSTHTIDTVNAFGGDNLSGLYYVDGGASGGVVYGVRNGPGTLEKIVPTGTGDGWGPAPGDWAAGKNLNYPTGKGDPDAEGITLTDAGPAGGVFVATERDNDVSGTSRPAILRFDDVEQAGTSLDATRDYNLTADLPGLGANLGAEGVAWVPDSYLVAHGYVDSSTTRAYDPSSYPAHSGGVFFVGIEATGTVYAYVLDQADNGYHRVGSFASGYLTIADIRWDAERQNLWTVCDDACNGVTRTWTVHSDGRFAADASYARPAATANLANEGFTIASQSTCSAAGLEQTFYADDGNDDGHSLRSGTIRCTPLPAQPSPSSLRITSRPQQPTVGDDYAVTTSGAAGVVSLTAGPASVCTISGSTVHFVAEGDCEVTARDSGGAGTTSGTVTQTVSVSPTPVLPPAAGVDLPGPGPDGWYDQPVMLRWTCTAGSAKVLDCPTDSVVGEGRHDSSVVTVHAADGGQTRVTVPRIDVDLTAPKVRLLQLHAAEPRCLARDALSGVASCTVTRHRSGHGRHRHLVVRAVAVDVAGNRTVVTRRA